MKSTEVSWRGRIGQFNRSSNRSRGNIASNRNYNTIECTFYTAFNTGYPSASIILLLLVIGGIEKNPGPVST
jgi:hypothetical protein